MSDLIHIGNSDILIKEYKGQRVVTFKDIDMVHGRPDGTARRNFNTNKKRFIEGEDFFVVGSDEIRSSHLFPISDNDYMDKVLLTEQGYLMLVKSFTDDLAWEVQRQLVNNYFNRKKPLSALEQIQLTQQAVIEVNEKIDSVSKDLQEFKQDMPLLALECERITRAKNRKVIELMGSKESNAYRDSSLRSKVYRDIDGQLRREFGINTYKAIKRSQCDKAIEIIQNYQLPVCLHEQINYENSQVRIEDVC